MKRTTILPILGLTCLSASILQVSAQTVQDGFGKASEGWQMEARPDTFEFKKASDIDLKFARWNVSGQDESFLLYDAEKMLHLEVVKDNGDPVPLTEHGKDIEAARGIVFFSSFVQVKPGESKEFTLALNKLLTFPLLASTS